MAATQSRPRQRPTPPTPPPHCACSVDKLQTLSARAQNARMRPPSELPPHLRNRPFTVAEARTAGLGRRRTRALDLVSPCYGVRATAATPDSSLKRVHALAAVTGAIVSHLSAAVLWGFPLPQALENLAVIHLTSRPGQRAVRHKNVVGHQQALEPEEIVTGVRVSCTSPLRTWFDLAGILSLDEMVVAGDFLLRRRNPLTTIDTLDAYLARKQGKAGYRSAMRARSLISAGTDSPKETELRLLLIRHGLPEPGINVPMFDETGGWIQDPDLSYEQERIAIQYDGGHHLLPAQIFSDRRRDKAFEAAGWTVLVLTKDDLTDGFAGATAKMKRILRAAYLSPSSAAGFADPV